MTRIKMVEEAEATGRLAEIYAAARSQSASGTVPSILKTMSLRPDFLAAIDEASRLSSRHRCTSATGIPPAARPV